MTELKTMLEVAQAKERGEVIEVFHFTTQEWGVWCGDIWHKEYVFRIQPKPKKTRKELWLWLWVNERTGECRYAAKNQAFVVASGDPKNWINTGTKIEVGGAR